MNGASRLQIRPLIDMAFSVLGKFPSNCLIFLTCVAVSAPGRNGGGR